MKNEARLGVLEIPELTERALRSLLTMETTAIRVRGFLDVGLCQRLSRVLHEDVVTADSSGTIYHSNVDSFWSARRSSQLLERYLSSAAPLEQRLRAISAPLDSPVDRVRRSLDAAWTAGAVPNAAQGRSMPFGITRLWETGSEALPHQDVLWREVAEHRADPEQHGQLGQLAVNVYLDTAKDGGELELWDYVVDESQYAKCKQEYEGSYGYPRSRLPRTSLLLAPEVGDLVLINSLRMHAVRKVTAGRRITLSGFIGHWGDDRPLRCWS
ncbi:MAG: 2OG-Fe(II) oxygenase [Kofleriaceae bacterium]